MRTNLENYFSSETLPAQTAARSLDNAILARARQCESEVSNLNAPCARVSAKARNVKSFLRVCTKLFFKRVVCASASVKAKCKNGRAPIIHATLRNVKSFCGVACNLF